MRNLDLPTIRPIICEIFEIYRFSPEHKGNIAPYTWIPFGSGPRNCIGMRLAILEAKLAMVHLIQKYKFTRSPNTEVQLAMRADFFIKKILIK